VHCCIRSLLAVLGCFLGLVASTLAQESTPENEPKKELPALTPEGLKYSKLLDESLPADSEARRMYDAIMAGSTLDAGEGWFGDSTGSTRFSWEAVKSQYDVNGDGEIGPYEFPGESGDFHRLDRDRSGAVTESDLLFPEHALQRTPGMMMFLLADRDANGRLTREEFASLFDQFDDERWGFLSFDDVKSKFAPPKPTLGATAPTNAGEPSRDVLLRGLYSQEIGAKLPGPMVGDEAPHFMLNTLDGESIDLGKRVGVRPIVLVFGNFTCGPFRGQAGNIEKLYHRYSDRADFLMVYVREAHPSDGWRMDFNDRFGIGLPQPKTYDERRSVAQTCRAALDFEMPFLVDTIDDAVGAIYSGMPSRLYLIDYAGKIAYKSSRGPFGFKPAELESSLLWLLSEPAPPAPDPEMNEDFEDLSAVDEEVSPTTE
jgi:hypothetical protein